MTQVNYIPDFQEARVLVVGDLMLDRYWHGDTSRISPEAPVPVVLVNGVEERAGGAGNVALNICDLGGRAAAIGLTGDDEAANALAKCLTGGGVECHFERLSGYPTVTKLRVLSHNQQLIRLDFENGFPGHDPRGLIARFRDNLDGCNAAILSDYGKGTLDCATELIGLARAAGKAVVVDPKGTDFSRYRGATVITPNTSEFEAVVGKCAHVDDLVRKGEALRRELELKALLITRSEKGMTLLRADHPPLHLPTKAREVYDVTGAGDTVVSVLAAGLGAGMDMAEATALANIAGGIVVGKVGTATVSVRELIHALREHEPPEVGVVDEERLVDLVREAQARGETVVMTNGCFDILHVGHVTYLEQAAKLGARLVVAVNDDASVSRLKGPDRPVNTMALRMRMLAALGFVDWVVPFYEDTPARLICRVQPDKLVKGGDNDPANIPGGDCVREAGGEVLVLDYVEDLSTSAIIRTIRASEKN
ncbi:Bifunctional protein hldE [Mycolicibacterium rhodesiae JS60]|nr:Bifunctional protein hldE [Mycolicibacterium rhodesiae JS60]